jgi:hypothetical protein
MLVTLLVIPANVGMTPYCSIAAHKQDPRLRGGDAEGTSA